MYVSLYLVVAEKRESLYLIQVVFQSIWRIRFLREPQGEYLGICYFHFSCTCSYIRKLELN